MPMTRAQWRVLRAYEALISAGAYHHRANHLPNWLRVRYGTEELHEITTAQARHARRQLNAWRHGARPHRHHHRIPR